MTALVQNTAVAATGEVQNSVATVATGLMADLRRFITYRETVAELRRLSSKELTDIGVEAGVEDYAWEISGKAVTR